MRTQLTLLVCRDEINLTDFSFSTVSITLSFNVAMPLVAAVVTPISCINYEGVDIEIPATGGITQKIWNELADIQYGNIKHPDGWSVHI